LKHLSKNILRCYSPWISTLAKFDPCQRQTDGWRPLAASPRVKCVMETVHGPCLRPKSTTAPLIFLCFSNATRPRNLVASSSGTNDTDGHQPNGRGQSKGYLDKPQARDIK